MADRDFYKTLGVPRTASEAELRKAYRNLARKHHPDRNQGNKAAEERFKEITQASDVLLNKRKRELYDEFGEMGLKDGFNADTFRQYTRATQAANEPRGGGSPGGANFEDLFGGMRGGFGGFDEFRGGSVEEILRNARRRAQRPRAAQQPPPEDYAPKAEIFSELTLSFIDALRGAEHTLLIPIPGEDARELRVRIPAGVKDGGQIRLRGQGIEGGDLVIKIHVEDHPYFKREDDDLLLNLPVTIGEAYNGAKIPVPTSEGDVTLTVPRGAKSGAKLRLRGKGVKSGERVGDLIVTLLIRLPDADDEETGKLVEKLDTKYADSPRLGIKL